MFSELKKSYTGGACDVYNCHGKDLYLYDANSLYPYVMQNFPVPVGNIAFFEGDYSMVKP